jgi:hypothetical protein
MAMENLLIVFARAGAWNAAALLARQRRRDKRPVAKCGPFCHSFAGFRRLSAGHWMRV